MDLGRQGLLEPALAEPSCPQEDHLAADHDREVNLVVQQIHQQPRRIRRIGGRAARSQPAAHARSTIRRHRSPAASHTARSWAAGSGGSAAARTVRDSGSERIGTKSSSHESSRSPSSPHRLQADHLRQFFVGDGRQLQFPQLHAAPAHRQQHLGP